ncbi:hypothetical protein HJFPF1_07269 [Paramyrothecium foliicola]|nr:hypothetical protein HJFPF1_07269 [Paramyrothecium foliicola]
MATIPSSAPVPVTTATPATGIPAPTMASNWLFSATVKLGKFLGPIPLLEGGNRLVEPITGGSISGPAFNATIEGGLAAPILVDDQSNGSKALLAYIWAYGTASDGSPFFIEESGLGTPAVQNTRLHVQVGGEYQNLQTMYVLAQPSVINEERTEAQVQCFSIELPGQ